MEIMDRGETIVRLAELKKEFGGLKKVTFDLLKKWNEFREQKMLKEVMLTYMFIEEKSKRLKDIKTELEIINMAFGKDVKNGNCGLAWYFRT